MKQKILFLAALLCPILLVKAQTYLGTNSFASIVNNPLPNQAAIEVRELNRGLEQTGSLGEAPSIGFHWGNRNWGHLLLDATGSFRFMNYNKSNYSSLYLENLYSFGNVGIGTTTPQARLDVNGTISSNGEIQNKLNGISNFRMISEAYGYMLRNDGVNTYMLLTNNGDAQGGWNALRPFRINNATGDVALAGEHLIISHSTGNVFASGNVGIGTTSPDEKLTVNGIVHAKEVRVDLTGALADYVFSKDYSLMPLHKVEQYVKTNSHLPDIPSADEVKQQGLGMGEMQNKLLQKIEELTLYVIQQQKEIQALKERIGTSPNPSEGGE
jgi:hypothetical protein